MESKFTERFIELRKEKGATQSDVADFVHISRTTVAKWETRGHQPNSSELNSLAEYFGVSSDYLLGNSDVRNPNQGYDIALAGKIEDLTDDQRKLIEKIIDDYRQMNKTKK